MNKKKQNAAPAPEFRGTLITLFCLVTTAAALIAFVFIFCGAYRDSLFPGIHVGQLDLGGKTYAAARAQLQESMNELADRGLTFRYGDDAFVIFSTISDPTNPELARRIFSYDIDATIARVKAATRAQSEAEHIFYWIRGWNVVPVVSIDREALIEALRLKLSSYEEPAKDAQLVIGDGDVMSVAAETAGRTFDYDGIAKTVQRHLNSFAAQTIEVELEPDIPEITAAGASEALDLAHQVLKSTPFILVSGDRSWELTQEQVRSWLTFARVDGQTTVGLAPQQLQARLEEIGKEINVEVREAKFTMDNGRVTEFQPSQTGRELDIQESVRMINEKIRQVGIQEIDLIVAETEPTITTDNVNNLGIQELIGEGHSNFARSPQNRRHNIKVGSDSLNGLLIKPGEEFSLVKALGKIEASTGYLPELVIKGNKTIPEYGGGLCQIGTTAFRVALDAGFPILERKSHSYRVSYYEPAGTDATIYDPKPDLRFVNDTEHYVLFTTELSGDDLYFRFYGTSDGRIVEQTAPRIYNQVQPGPTKYIETLDQKPGVTKCTESAHAGADAEFTRTVSAADGTKKTDTFTSHYVPWQAVCLVGVEKLSPEATQ
ncbi:MAG: VanW family protein [Patescibacteria group bacterium]|nr:VanW family protein [Patescibacteria group bacterium]MDD5715662.1 VanW family protein [Patescibacteria group bacterium]